VTAITVHCLGAFRDLGDRFTVEVDKVTVSSIREAVSRHLVDINRSDLDAVLKRSVFAEGDELLKDHVTVSGNEVSLLPPVAGG
jgi:molybdopterin converting factor small subunit